MTVYDGFMFHSENDMVALRLELLNDVVDKHIIVEARETHSGQPKALYFDYKRFRPYHDKIRYIVIDRLSAPDRNSAWIREPYHRSRITLGLDDASDDDLVIVSDVDEIPNPKVIPLIETRARLKLRVYYYNIHNRVGVGWSIGACRWGFEKDVNAIRTAARFGDDAQDFQLGGWHLSNFMSAEAITAKVQAFMHHDFARRDQRLLDVNYVRDKMRAGEDVYDLGHAIHKVDDRAMMPSELINHPKWGWNATV